MANYYPPVGFHFAVAFELLNLTDLDFRFQEVTGLSVNLETQAVKAGGENRFTYQLPLRTTYDHLVLKRGLVTNSVLMTWIKEAVENYEYVPTNVVVTLLNDRHIPLMAWYVVNAYPVKWSVANLNAEQSGIAIESLEFNYQYFRALSIPDVARILLST